MKRFYLTLLALVFSGFGLFAQVDLQPLGDPVELVEDAPPQLEFRGITPAASALRTANTVPINVSPANASIAVSKTGAVKVDFSGPINPSSVNAASFVVRGEVGGVYPGVYTFSNGNSTIEFTPDSAYFAGELINVNVTDSILDTTGAGVLPWASKFWVEAVESEGYFGPAVLFSPGPQEGNFGVKAYDLNQDGLSDWIGMIFGSGFQGSGSGMVNNDSRIVIYYNLGGGAFSNPINISLSLPAIGCGEAWGLDVGDVNGDGFGDLVAAVRGPSCSHAAVLLNDGFGGFPTIHRYPTTNAPEQISLSDLNGDGFLDIVSGGGALASQWVPEVVVLLNNGNGIFGNAQNYSAGLRPFGLAHADMDHDGDVDLLSGNSGSNSFSLLMNDGFGSFGLPSSYQVGTAPRGIETGDLNGDGLVDVVVANQNEPSITIYMNQGGGVFGGRKNYPTNGRPVGVGVSDLNGDGNLDVVTANHHEGVRFPGKSISVFTNVNGYFDREDFNTFGSQPVDVDFGDFNGDGMLDILVCHLVGSFAILYNQPANITGEVYEDKNQNCSRDSLSEGPVLNALIKAENELGDEYFAYTDSHGKYTFAVPANHTYSVRLASGQGYTPSCNFGTNNEFIHIIYPETVASPGNRMGLDPFCEATLGGFLELKRFCSSPACLHGPSRTPCPCETFDYVMNVSNLGTGPIPANSQVRLSLPDHVKLCELTPTSTTHGISLSYLNGVSDSPCPVSICSIGNEYAGDVIVTLDSTLPAGGVATIRIPLATADVVPTGQSLDFVSEFIAWPGDATCLGNTTPHTYQTTLACSYDPNDKKVYPPDTYCEPVASHTPLTYTVRFQNTGSAPAYRVEIKDQIDSDLDLESFRVIATSHDLTQLRILPGNVVSWVFEGINLPDSSSDLANSMGYLQYSIYPKSDVDLGAVIQNKAEIYFDANEPVITNTTVTQVQGDYGRPAEFEYYQLFDCDSEYNDAFWYEFAYTGGEIGAELEWSFGPDADVSSSSSVSSVVHFSGSGDKTISLSVTIGHCSWTKSMEFRVRDQVPICHDSGPSDDGGNGQFSNFITILVPISELNQHLEHGDSCGPCANSKQNSEAATETALSTLMVFPNPTQEGCHVLSTDGRIDRLELINALGQTVHAAEPKKAEAFVPTDKLPDGVYVLKVWVKGGLTSERIVVAR